MPSHNSHNDHWVLLKHYMPNFLAANVVKGALKYWMEMAGVIFFDRNETDEQKRLEVLEEIKKRQQLAETNLDFNPICVFPEGHGSNGKYLLPFKRGAFESLCTVLPLVLHYKGNGYSHMNCVFAPVPI